MKYKLCMLFFFLCSFSIDVFSEEIYYKKSVWGNIYTIQGERVGPDGKGYNRMKSALMDNPEAVRKIEESRKYYSPAKGFSMVGGFLIGWPIGSSIGGGEFNSGMFAGGIGLAAIGLWFNKKSDRKIEEAIEIAKKHQRDKDDAFNKNPSQKFSVLSLQYSF